MAIKLILVCKEGPAKQAYLRETAAIGAEVDTVETFGDLFKAMIMTAYQGVLVDLVTSVRSSREEKGIAQKILDVFPIMQLKWESETNTIHTISSSQTLQNSTMANFVTQECIPFQPRAIRLNARKYIYFNLLMNKTEDLSAANAERSVTVNISKAGCFLFSCQDWSSTNEIWFVINELTDKTPIRGEIRWRQPWGKTMAIPGVGLSFNQISSSQLSQLVEKFDIF